MYEARGNQIFINDELFITVHPTDTTVPPVEQARIIAEMLNGIMSD